MLVISTDSSNKDFNESEVSDQDDVNSLAGDYNLRSRDEMQRYYESDISGCSNDSLEDKEWFNTSLSELLDQINLDEAGLVNGIDDSNTSRSLGGVDDSESDEDYLDNDNMSVTSFASRESEQDQSEPDVSGPYR